MTQPETPASSPESEHTASSVDPASASETPPPAPEPWTGERVREWNAYYDLYVVLGVLLLVFVASANKISHSTIWAQLKAGQVMAAKGAPVPLTTDPFTYTMEGKRWVNIPWLFEWSHAVLYDAVVRLIPPDPNDPISATRRAEQVGAGVLVGLTALIRVATLLVLLSIRRTGPGLWWAAVCGTLALGAIYNPLGIMLGGISGPAAVSPDTWGQFFLAVQLLLIHRTINLGHSRSIFGLVPLFLLWANVSDSFLIGLLILAATVVGRKFAARQPSGEPDPLPFSTALVLLAVVSGVCVVNPSGYHAYLAALEPFFQLFQSSSVVSSEQLSYFGKGIRGRDPAAPSSVWVTLIAFYLLIVAAGLASFWLNRARFSVGRFLGFVVAAILWALYIRLGLYFAIVFAAILTLNGQEWYQSRFGMEGRLGRGWSIWSTGGRFVTILLVFLLVAKGLTGYGRTAGESVFGFGFNPDDFAFEAADYLKTSKIQGRVLNTTRLQGDSLIWRANPLQKPYIDGRHNLFPQSLQEELHKIRLALSEDAVETWKPLLDAHNISAVMIEPTTAPKTYRALMNSTRWIPFYDDGSVVMFGRADASANDLEVFKTSRLDADLLAYQTERPLPPFDRPPTPVGRMDEVFQNRFRVFAQPHTESAERWLLPLNPDPTTPSLPDPARCIMAVREARIALSRKPDDTQAYRLLNQAYRDLMMLESALLVGLELKPENAQAIAQVPLQSQRLMNRFRQRVTALNFAIQTTPPPRRPDESQALFRLNLELSQLYMSVNFRDLGRDRLQAALRYATYEPQELRSQLSQEFSRLDDSIRQLQDEMAELLAAQQAGPLNRADYAISQGAPGLAILELEEALQLNVNVNAVKPHLIDLYCDSGQPEKAFDIIATSSAIDDPTLGAEPGMAAYRQGRVYLLLGNYGNASTLWKNHSIPQVRLDRSFSALGSSMALIHGEPKQAASTIISLPGKLNTQAFWEEELGFCQLESGEPTQAGESFLRALDLSPELTVRPVIAYYLEKLGKTVPPLPEKAETTEAPTKKADEASPKTESAPSDPKPETDAANQEKAQPKPAQDETKKDETKKDETKKDGPETKGQDKPEAETKPEPEPTKPVQDEPKDATAPAQAESQPK